MGSSVLKHPLLQQKQLHGKKKKRKNIKDTLRCIFLLGQEYLSGEKAQKKDVESESAKTSKTRVCLHYIMPHRTVIPAVATGIGWLVLLPIFRCCSHAGFLSHNYSIALLLSVVLLYTLMLVLEAFVLKAFKVSGV